MWPKPLLFYYFDLEEKDSEYAEVDTIKPVPESQVMAIVQSKRYQLIAQCKDLLRLNSDPHEPTMLRDRVSFLHRTVSDFFRNEAMEAILSTRVGTEYEPRITLSRAFLAMIKSVPPWWIPKKIIHLSRIRALTLAAIFYAKELEQLQNTEMFNMVLLDRLDAALRDLLTSLRIGKNVSQIYIAGLALRSWRDTASVNFQSSLWQDSAPRSGPCFFSRPAAQRSLLN